MYIKKFLTVMDLVVSIHIIINTRVNGISKISSLNKNPKETLVLIKEAKGYITIYRYTNNIYPISLKE